MIETRNLKFVYSENTPFEKQALKGIDIKINDGEFIGIIGHTGSGKSTFIQILNGLVKPTCGKVLIDGVDIWKEPKKIRNIRFKVGLVFQYPEHQLFEETVYDDIAFGPKNMGLSKDEIEKRVLSAISFVNLRKDDIYKSPFDLSGGQKRRVAIAGVMAMMPKILILDEPTAGLDPLSRDNLIKRIKDYHKESGATVLFVSHNMEDIAKIADRVLVLNSGEVEMFDTSRNIFLKSERLEEIGLEVPAITRIIRKLKKKGYELDDSVITVDEGLREILRLINKEKKHD